MPMQNLDRLIGQTVFVKDFSIQVSVWDYKWLGSSHTRPRSCNMVGESLTTKNLAADANS